MKKLGLELLLAPLGTCCLLFGCSPSTNCMDAAQQDDLELLSESEHFSLVATPPGLGAPHFYQGKMYSRPGVAFNRLADSPCAALAFGQLLESELPAARLYGLCGLYFADPDRFQAEVAGMRSLPGSLQVYEGGCFVSRHSVASLIDSSQEIDGVADIMSGQIPLSLRIGGVPGKPF